MPESYSRVWFLVGSSTGIGRALAEALVDDGKSVVATARQVEDIAPLAARAPERVRIERLDVTDSDSVTTAVGHAIAAFGRIDVLVNCAGLGLYGSVEESSLEDARQVFETNVFGTQRVLQAVLPHMRRQRSGHIVGVTSKGAFQSQPGVALYCASKAATMSIYEGLAAEVAPLGIRVTIIAPGLVRSCFKEGNLVADVRLADYELTCGPIRASVEVDYPAHAIEPRAAARSILEALNAAEPPAHLPVGADALEMIDRRLAQLNAEIKPWRELAASVSSKAERPMV
jgi:NAD(P)-dependent dehydrogenase (short-subunit alcohol dehydrogenase family)